MSSTLRELKITDEELQIAVDRAKAVLMGGMPKKLPRKDLEQTIYVLSAGLLEYRMRLLQSVPVTEEQYHQLISEHGGMA